MLLPVAFPSMKSLIESICSGVRVDELPGHRFCVYPSSCGKADELSKGMLGSGKVDAGREGHEYLRALGLVQHVFALRLGEVYVRIVSPAVHPRGMFSDLHSLEREISAG